VERRQSLNRIEVLVQTFWTPASPSGRKGVSSVSETYLDETSFSAKSTGHISEHSEVTNSDVALFRQWISRVGGEA
jgi:hypothetical protein